MKLFAYLLCGLITIMFIIKGFQFITLGLLVSQKTKESFVDDDVNNDVNNDVVDVVDVVDEADEADEADVVDIENKDTIVSLFRFKKKSKKDKYKSKRRKTKDNIDIKTIEDEYLKERWYVLNMFENISSKNNRM